MGHAPENTIESFQNGPLRTAASSRATTAWPRWMSVGGCSSFSVAGLRTPKLGSTKATWGSGGTPGESTIKSAPRKLS